jgi:threonyl-tRNA synthetase
VLPIGEAHRDYARSVYEKLLEENIRVELDMSDETLGKKIRAGKTEKIPYLLVIGDKEIEGKMITVESRDKGSLGSMALEQFLERIKKEISTRFATT